MSFLRRLRSPDRKLQCIFFTLIGIGYGFATFVATSQISMYFSSLRPLANGVVTSGSPVLSIIFPYLARDFMEKYGWRGSFLITGAISLNMSVFGSLIRPISAISNQCKRLKSADGEMCETDFTTNDEHHLNATTSLRKLERNTAETTQKKKNRSFTSFLRQYSLAFAFLFVNFLFAQCMYNPNVFIVPYAAQLGFTELESTLLLSFISVGDFLGRLGSGLIASKFNFSLNCSLLVISSCALLLAALQLAPLFHPTFPVLMMYVTIYGLAFGGVVTLTFSVIGQSMNVKTVEIAMATLFFSHGIAVLVGGPMAGEFLCEVQHGMSPVLPPTKKFSIMPIYFSGFIVDKCRGFKAVFWYTFISGSLSGSLYFFLSYLVRQLGSLILENGKQKIAASECNHNI